MTKQLKLELIASFYYDPKPRNCQEYVGLRTRGSIGVATHVAYAEYWKDTLRNNPDVAALWEVVPI